MTIKETNRYRVAVFVSHPIHYLLGWFRQLAEQESVDLTVLLACDYGLKPAFDPTSGVVTHWYDDTILAGLKYRFLRLKAQAPGGFFSNFAPRLWSEMHQDHYDALIVRGYATLNTYWAYLVAASVGVPVIFHAETTLSSANNRIKRLLKRQLLIHLFRRSAVCLPIGSESYQFYLEHGVPPEKLFLSPYAVDNAFFAGEWSRLHPRRIELRRQLGIANDMPVILSVGKLSQRKRPMDLLLAFEALQQQASLVFVGDGLLMEELKNYVRDRSMQHVYFAGFQAQDQLPRYYALADIFAFTSEYEPWGLVLNEALCCGLPVVVSEGVVAGRDLVKQDVNGFCYPVGNTLELSELLKRLIESPILRENFGESSRQIINTWGYIQDVQATLDALRYIGANQRS